MSRVPSTAVIDSRLQIALKAAEECGLTVYGYRIGERGEVHIITNAEGEANGSEADKWLAEN